MANRIPYKLGVMLSLRQSLADALPAATMRDDSRLDAIHTLDVQIAQACANIGVAESAVWYAFTHQHGMLR